MATYFIMASLYFFFALFLTSTLWPSITPFYLVDRSSTDFTSYAYIVYTYIQYKCMHSASSSLSQHQFCELPQQKRSFTNYVNTNLLLNKNNFWLLLNPILFLVDD